MLLLTLLLLLYRYLNMMLCPWDTFSQQSKSEPSSLNLDNYQIHRRVIYTWIEFKQFYWNNSKYLIEFYKFILFHAINESKIMANAINQLLMEAITQRLQD